MKKTTTILITILVLAFIIVTAIWLNKHNMAVAPAEVITQSPVVITDKPITEANFTGSRPIITGTSVIVTAANQYIDEQVAAFKKDADAQVPGMREQFGNDAPPANYTIEFKAQYKDNGLTESVIIPGYRYTGGANGFSSYKVFTAKKDSTTLLSLGDIVPLTQRDSFVAFVKKDLLTRQEAVFAEDVNTITFESLRDFSLDNDSLILYFDKYTIGPGALGSVAFSIPVSSIQQYLSL